MKPLFSTEQLLRNEVTPRLAKAAGSSTTLRRNIGTKPILPPAEGQQKGARK